MNNRDEPPIEFYPEEFDIKCQKAGNRVLKEFSSNDWGQLYHSIYKYSDYGITLGVLFSNQDSPIYCRNLYDLGKDNFPIEIHVSSILEGVEEKTSTHIIKLSEPTPAKKLRKAIELIEEEAEDIWQNTHGCEGCAKLNGQSLNSEEYTPVNINCKKCCGEGCCF
jgi:hypothetical protein